MTNRPTTKHTTTDKSPVLQGEIEFPGRQLAETRKETAGYLEELGL